MLAKSDNAIDNLIDVDFVPYRWMHSSARLVRQLRLRGFIMNHTWTNTEKRLKWNGHDELFDDSFLIPYVVM